jgi:hypothetical protein
MESGVLDLHGRQGIECAGQHDGLPLKQVAKTPSP